MIPPLDCPLLMKTLDVLRILLNVVYYKMLFFLKKDCCHLTNNIYKDITVHVIFTLIFQIKKLIQVTVLPF